MSDNAIISLAETLLGLVPSSYDVSTGLLVEHDGDYVFAIQNPNRWAAVGERKETGLVGVGGKLEEGETVIACAKRECLEELDVGVEIVDSERSYLIKEDEIREIPLDVSRVSPRPYFIVLSKSREPGRKAFTIVLSYKGNLEGVPRPVDVSALALGGDSTLSCLADGPKTVEFLREKGLRTVEKIPIPDDLYLRPYGTLAAYLRLLTRRAGGSK